MRCPRCDFENDPAGTYCQQCGTYLQPFTPAPQPQAGFPIPPPAPLEYSTPPFISAGMHAELFSSQQMVSSRPRMTVFRVIRSIVYFIATFIAAFGLIGSIGTVSGESESGAVLATFSGLGLLVAGGHHFCEHAPSHSTVAGSSFPLGDTGCDSWDGHGSCLCSF
jgi:hypothetical protein